jgi:hypothetical protein
MPWDNIFSDKPVPPGKQTESYGKSHFLMGKSTISMGDF